MTKQPPFATKLRLSKLCRGIIALACVKLCVLVALVADIPLPELRWEKPLASQEATQASTAPAQAASVSSSASAPASPQSTTLVMGKPERSLLAASQPPAGTGSSVGAEAKAQPEPQGSAAAAAAARVRPMAAAPSTASITMPVSNTTRETADDVSGKNDLALAASKPAVQTYGQVDAQAAVTAQSVPAQSAPAPTAPAPTVATQTAPASTAQPASPQSPPLALLASGVEGAEKPAPSSERWWKNMLQLKKLPIPHMGVTQVAHAAALDTPPAPTVPQGGNTSPFTPPAQQILRGQDANGAPIPPRSAANRPQPAPAGSSGLPLGTTPVPTNSVDPMTTAVPPPSPNVNAYSPPEDPNRKQQELARREQEILMLKQQMEQRLKELESAEMRVKGMIKDATDVESKKVSGLIAVYANMKPKQAAQTLQSLDERVAVRILTGLSPKQAGEILSYADPKITAKLTELMTRMQMQP